MITCVKSMNPDQCKPLEAHSGERHVPELMHCHLSVER